MFECLDLTDSFPMKFDHQRMCDELSLLEDEKWLPHYDEKLADGWTAIPMVSHDGSTDDQESQRLGKWGEYKQTKYVDQLPYFRKILDAFQCPHGRIRIMKLLPGTIIREHRDTYSEVSDFSFGQVRLHIPIVTNEKVEFRVGKNKYHLKEGRLYYINFSKKHYVRNDGDEPRTHLVLDLKMNDFLRSVFPKLTLWQKIESRIIRRLVPVFLWWPQRTMHEISGGFWRKYEGSVVQRIRHKVLPKRNRTNSPLKKL